MDTALLATAISLVRNDFQAGGIRKKLASLQQKAQEAAGNPTDAAIQDQFIQAADELNLALAAAKSNRAPISVIKTLEAVDASDLIGDNIRLRIEAILAAKPFLLPQAAKKLNEVVDSVTASFTQVTACADAMSTLGIEPKPLELDQYELGILMPSSFTGDDLREIQKHLRSWVAHLDNLEELVTGQTRPLLPVRSVSSGSFNLFVGLDIEGAVALLLIARGAVAIFQSTRDAKERREELEKAGYPDEVLDGMKRHEDTLVDKGKEQIANKVLMRAKPGLDPGRRNQLETALRMAIDYVLKSMNRGVDVEVSTPAEPKDQDKSVDAEVKALRSEIEKIRKELVESIKHLPDRTEPILQLPPPQSPSEAADTAAPRLGA